MSAAKVGAAVVLAVGLFSVTAVAEEPAKKPAQKGVIELDRLILNVRPPRPQVGVDVARLVPRAPLPDLRQPLLDRLAKTADKACF
jgi:hypothetical protein